MVDIEWQKMPPHQSEEAEERLYPRVKVTGVTDFEQLCKKTAKRSVYDRGTLKGAFISFVDMIVDELREGRSVELGELGMLHLSVGTNGPVTSSTKNRKDRVYVRGVNLQTSTELLEAIGRPEFRCLAESAPVSVPKTEELVGPLRDYLAAHGSISRQQFQDQFGLKGTTAKERLRELIRMGVIRQVGKNRETVYEGVG